MPTYEYACSKCGKHLEVYQSFSEEPLKRHSGCGGKLNKVFGSVGIVLKGSGFYRNDSRSSSRGKGSTKKGSEEKTTASSESSTSASNGSSDGSSSSDTSKSSKPAKSSDSSGSGSKKTA
jgi:putative FmdB family regulatory protein